MDVGPKFCRWKTFDNDKRDCGREAVPLSQSKAGPNDLVLMKVARDDANICFYVQTREPHLAELRLQ